jgi:hypothetical protein
MDADYGLRYVLRLVAKRLAVALGALALALPASALAAAPTRDSVTGDVVGGEGRGAVGFTLDASSAPSGESPAGTIDIYAFVAGDLGTFDISCLGVNGNRATVVAPFPNTQPPAPAGVVVRLEDNGAAGDGVDWDFVSALPGSCPAPASVAQAATSGGVTIVDALPPTRYADCRLGGWVAYGFAGHSACIAAVHDLARS